MKQLRCVKLNEEFVIKHDRNYVSIGYLPKLITFTGLVLEKIQCYNCRIVFIKGKNVIVFKNQEDCLDAIDYFNSLMVLDRLK